MLGAGKGKATHTLSKTAFVSITTYCIKQALDKRKKINLKEIRTQFVPHLTISQAWAGWGY